MLTYELDRASGISLYDQLYRCIRADIEAGALMPGDRLPSKRVMAKHLGVSVITVEGALAQLVTEGYVVARERRGYFVAAFEAAEWRTGTKPSASTAGSADGAPPNFSCHPERSAQREVEGSLDCAAALAFTPAGSASASPNSACRPPLLADFTGASAPKGLFPYQKWARTVRYVLAEESEETLLSASHPQGSLALREAIAAHLRGFRGVEVSPEQIVIAAGAQTLYQLIVQLLKPRGGIAVEDPGYPRLRRICETVGVHVHAVPLTDAGPAVDKLRASGAELMHCMPSHQFPTGTTMTAPKRYELLDWAYEAEGRYLIEDDYDCEFRMAGRPIPPLMSADRAGRVIYLNTFTKSLGAAFRIGYMVLPPDLVRRFRDSLGFYSCTVGAIDQATLTRFIRTGDYERHCNRLRNHYHRLAQNLVQALGKTTLGAQATFDHVGAGLHFAMTLPGITNSQAEQAFLNRAGERGVKMRALSHYAHDPATAETYRGRFLISFDSVEEPRIPAIAAALAEAAAETSSIPPQF